MSQVGQISVLDLKWSNYHLIYLAFILHEPKVTDPPWIQSNKGDHGPT
jgi:hypothetical protein